MRCKIAGCPFWLVIFPYSSTGAKWLSYRERLFFSRCNQFVCMWVRVWVRACSFIISNDPNQVTAKWPGTPAAPTVSVITVSVLQWDIKALFINTWHMTHMYRQATVSHTRALLSHTLSHPHTATMAPVFQQGIARLKSCTASLTAIWCTPTFTNLQLLNHTHTFIFQQHLICIGGLLKDAISANSDIRTKSLRTISLGSPVYLSHCFPVSACFFLQA